MIFVILVSLLLGVVAGVNVENYMQNNDCVRAEAIYNQAVRNFKKDLRTGGGDELLMADEYRKFERYMDMERVCK
ncbi:hypothetical protein FR830_24835 (plasmid) [Klebsiella aerogenes]|uniref:hypothetical protein n=1 Tax=Klebsiella aerogenes TaxID=548 RepID=UPI00124D4AAF|nr:hypothetical protein [Klebsiella aerogenes]QFI19856.1 hypothetical protein FR830_24835 [Klebsiella aerogenes]